MNKEPASIIIIENQPLMLAALSTTFAAEGMQVLAEVERNGRTLETAKKLTPDPILFSVGHPSWDDLQILSALRKEVPTSLILALVTGEFNGQEQSALDHGAHQVLTRITPRSELLSTVKRMLYK
jgi:DNA-binding NarL/FixJ family response regulator